MDNGVEENNYNDTRVNHNETQESFIEEEDIGDTSAIAEKINAYNDEIDEDALDFEYV